MSRRQSLEGMGRLGNAVAGSSSGSDASTNSSKGRSSLEASLRKCIWRSLTGGAKLNVLYLAE